MRLFSGKRIGQSGAELTLAVFFSFFLHIFVVLGAVFLYITGTPKAHIPPFYQVKLVGQPADLSQTPKGEAVPAPQQQKESSPKKAKPSPKSKKTASKPIKAAPKKGALPELTRKTPKPTTEPEPAETRVEQPQAPAGAPAVNPTPSAGKTENVSVTTQQQDFKFSWYLGLVRDKIGQNWRPTPDAADAKARVIFTINRSGWVGDVNLDPEHSSGTYGFKAAAIRAIRSSNPFPPLPEDFSKQSLAFTVDLMAE